MRFVIPVIAVLGALSPALAQETAPPAPAAPAAPPPAPPATPPAAEPPAATQKPATEAKAEKPEPTNLRIRGTVDRVEGTTIAVQLSQGLSVRVETQVETPVMEASRLERSALKPGMDIRVRTRTGAQGVSVATEVMALELTGERAEAARTSLDEAQAQGSYKTVEDKAGEDVLVLTEKGTDRRVTLSKETSFWRLRSAAVGDLKPGMTVSVMIVREADQPARARRLVYGSTATGAALPM